MKKTRIRIPLPAKVVFVIGYLLNLCRDLTTSLKHDVFDVSNTIILCEASLAIFLLIQIINIGRYFYYNKIYLQLNKTADFEDIIKQIPNFPVRKSYTFEILVFERVEIQYYKSLLNFWPQLDIKGDYDFFSEQYQDMTSEQKQRFVCYLTLPSKTDYLSNEKFREIINQKSDSKVAVHADH